MPRFMLFTILATSLLLSSSTSDAAVLYGLTGTGGTPQATLHVINQADASVTPILPLNDNNGGQVIAYNPDDGFMYHWTGYPSSNALFERINLASLQVTNIPVSGYATNEIYSATYDPARAAFLTTDISFNFSKFTTDGERTYLGSTSTWIRGLAYSGETLYGGRNSISDDSLYTIDSNNGEILSAIPVVMDGYTVAAFISQATHPETGELWALLVVEELPRKTRVLATIEPTSGVATLVGTMPAGSGFSSIAFVPDPVISVEIDVKPGDELNALNTGSNGVIPVAILSSSDEFDATQIDPISISLEGAEVSVRGKGKLLAHEEDVNGDGLIDLVCQVETESLTFDLEVGEVCLTGETTDGRNIAGCDLVVIVPDLE